PLLIVVCKAIGTRTVGSRWVLPGHLDWKEPVLLCRCNGTNTALRDYYLLGRLPGGHPTFRDDDSFLQKWRTGTTLPSLFGNARRVASLETHSSGSTQSAGDQGAGYEIETGNQQYEARNSSSPLRALR